MKVEKYHYCKYLEDLGLSVEKYGTNFTERNDKRNKKWRKQRKKYGFDEREVWNVDLSFIEWIYTRFRMYKDIAGVDLNYHKFNFKGKEITQLEAINIILLNCEKYLTSDFLDREMFPEEVGKLLIDIMPAMWW